MSKKDAIKFLAMAAAFGGFNEPPQKREVIIHAREKIPPSGCKEYFFKSNGEFYAGEGRPMLKSETVFHCIALNNKNAKKKFNNWLKLQSVV